MLKILRDTCRYSHHYSFYRQRPLIMRSQSRQINTIQSTAEISDHDALGNESLLKQDYQKALEHYLLCKNKPYNKLGVCYAQLQQFDAAKDAYHSALNLNQKSIETNYHLGCLYYCLADFVKAIEFFKVSHDLDPSHILVKKNYLLALYKAAEEAISKNQLNTAKQYFDEMTKYDEWREYALTGKGKIGIIEKKYDQAIGYFREAIKINPRHVEPRQLFFRALSLNTSSSSDIPGFKEGLIMKLK